MKVFVFLLLAAALVLSAADVTVSGTWSGHASVTQPDGTVVEGSAFAVLKQEGAQLVGTAGPDEENQWPITKGSIAGDKVTLEVKDTGDGTIYKCTLALDGDHLKGPVAVVTPDGQTMKGKLDLAKVK